MKNYIRYFATLFSLFLLIGASCDKSTTDPGGGNPPEPPVEEKNFVFGVDLSYINQIEDKGGLFKDGGAAVDPYQAFADKGANMVRLRLWHNPAWIYDIYGSGSELYSGFSEVQKSIRRAKDQGMAVNLDFHYSDVWADPEHQDPPAAWKAITDIDVLCDSVYNYTYKVLHNLYQQNLLPEMVQIGNETNCGMMHTNTESGFPNLNVCNNNWSNMGKVLNAGIRAVRAIDDLSGDTTIIALHIADPKNLDWWFTNIINRGGVTDFDVAGFSYYHIWHTQIGFNQLGNTVRSLINKINKEVMVLETAYPFTPNGNDSYHNIYGNQDPVSGYEYTLAGQKQFMIDLCQNMIDAGASGVMYWEPGWITSNMQTLWGVGSAWENCAMFNFSGNLTDAVNYLNYDYSYDE